MAARKATTETEHKIEDFAEELGRLLGTARAKADSWLGQRQQIAKTLEGIRDTATGLLTQLGHQAEGLVRRGRKAKLAYQPAPKSKRTRRKMSAAARKAISEAQKARWAKQKGEKK